MFQLKNLTFGYSRNKLFNSLNLSLEPGNIYGLLGKNGAGKTSLLRIISGQILPESGECSIFGEEPGKRTPEFLSRVFFVPEEYNLPGIGCREYEEIFSPFYPEFNRELLYEYLRELEIDSSKRLTSLSFGQRKKFLLAFGMASQCPLLILDEPTNGLDIPSKSQLRKLITSSISEERTFIISTHQVRDLENIIDPIVILDSGKIIFNSPLESVTRNLKVEMLPDLPQGQEVLYYEKVLGGYSVISRNDGSAEGNINLEGLFNLVLSAPDKIKEIFPVEGEHEYK